MSGDGIAAAIDQADETLTSAIPRLAALDAAEYEQCRKDMAKRLNVRVGYLDQEVSRERKGKGNGKTESESYFQEIEPWPEPVDGGDLLDRLCDAFRRFLALRHGADRALSLWALFTHVHDGAAISPLLAVCSPEPRCGKTTTLFVLKRLVPRALSTASMSPASLFRSIDMWAPTLLVDEADTFLRDNDDLRGILNAGHTKDAAGVIRTVGDDHEPKVFNVWAPKAIALIGTLHPTLADRSILVSMRRKSRAEHVERFRIDRENGLSDLARQCARWAADNMGAFQAGDPAIPLSLHDRAADNWRPLIAIADIAGGHWPETARQTAEALSADLSDGETARAMLLRDIKAIFETRRIDTLPTQAILDELHRMDERPWPEWNRGRPISARGLAKQLQPFGIAPSSIRVSGELTQKGYRLASFADAFIRYISPQSPVSPDSIRHTAQPAESVADSDLLSGTEAPGNTLSGTENPAETVACAGVPDKNPGKGAVGKVLPSQDDPFAFTDDLIPNTETGLIEDGE